MENFLNKLNDFFFGKHLKLILFCFGILFGLLVISPYRNPDSEVVGSSIRYGIMSFGLIFTAVYMHMNENRK